MQYPIISKQCFKPPLNPPKFIKPHTPAFETIQLRSHVKVEAQLSRPCSTHDPSRPFTLRRIDCSLTLIEINHIFHPLSSATLNDPVMTIEWR